MRLPLLLRVPGVSCALLTASCSAVTPPPPLAPPVLEVGNIALFEAQHPIWMPPGSWPGAVVEARVDGLVVNSTVVRDGPPPWASEGEAGIPALGSALGRGDGPNSAAGTASRPEGRVLLALDQRLAFRDLVVVEEALHRAGVWTIDVLVDGGAAPPEEGATPETTPAVDAREVGPPDFLGRTILNGPQPSAAVLLRRGDLELYGKAEDDHALIPSSADPRADARAVAVRIAAGRRVVIGAWTAAAVPGVLTVADELAGVGVEVNGFQPMDDGAAAMAPQAATLAATAKPWRWASTDRVPVLRVRTAHFEADVPGARPAIDTVLGPGTRDTTGSDASANVHPVRAGR